MLILHCVVKWWIDVHKSVVPFVCNYVPFGAKKKIPPWWKIVLSCIISLFWSHSLIDRWFCKVQCKNNCFVQGKASCKDTVSTWLVNIVKRLAATIIVFFVFLFFFWVGVVQFRAKRRVNIGLTFISWPKTWLQINANVCSMPAGCVNRQLFAKMLTYFLK